MENILDRIERGEVILFDGAIGTMIMQRGLEPGRPPESINLQHPETLEEVARLYSDAGADCLTTNTFGGSPYKLKASGLDRAEEINRIAVEAAKRAAGDSAYVAGSCGPCGALLQPYGPADASDIYNSFLKQASWLAEAGADVIVVETMIDLGEAILATRAAKAAAPNLPVMATMTFDASPKGFHTVMGNTIAQAADGLADAGADIVGSNCGNGIEKMFEIAEEFVRVSNLPVAIQSNAGLPETRDGELYYSETPEFMAGHVKRLLGIGVKVIGGCCGTTPDHIRAFREVIDS